MHSWPYAKALSYGDLFTSILLSRRRRSKKVNVGESGHSKELSVYRIGVLIFRSD
jgi:hypothetical protein